MLHATPKKFKLPSWYILLPIALLLVVIGVYVGRMTASSVTQLHTNEDTATMAEVSQSLAVEAISPVPNVADSTISASGIIAAKEMAQVGSRVSGVAIDAVLVEVGDQVQAGQVLAVLDATAATEQVNMANAEYVQANAALAKASADLARIEPLIAIDAISREQYDAYVTAKIQAQANLEAAAARLRNAQLNQGNTHVIAPVSGIISEKNANVGMTTTGGVLFSIVKDGVLEWQASVPAAQESRIELGQIALIDVGSGTNKDTVGAVVTRISPIANNSRELTVHALLEDSSRLRAGMYQSGRFILDRQTVVTLPYRTITSTDGKDYVWVLTKADNGLYRASRQQVRLGGRVGEQVAVDLPLETLVVKEGGGFLREGDLVRVVAPEDTAGKVGQL